MRCDENARTPRGEVNAEQISGLVSDAMAAQHPTADAENFMAGSYCSFISAFVSYNRHTVIVLGDLLFNTELALRRGLTAHNL